MDQIPVRGMNFQNSKACVQGAPRRVRERLYDCPNAFLRQSLGKWVLVRVCDGARRDGDPRTFFRRKFAGADPGLLGTPFSASVCELHAGHGTLALEEMRDSRKIFDVRVTPNSQVLRADAPLGGYRSGLGKNKPGPAYCAAPQVY